MQVSRPSLQDMIGVRIAQSCVFSSQERRSSGLATSLQRLSGAGTICCSQLKSLLPILPAPCSSDNRPALHAALRGGGEIRTFIGGRCAAAGQDQQEYSRDGSMQAHGHIQCRDVPTLADYGYSCRPDARPDQYTGTPVSVRTSFTVPPQESRHWAYGAPHEGSTGDRSSCRHRCPFAVVPLLVIGDITATADDPALLAFAAALIRLGKGAVVEVARCLPVLADRRADLPRFVGGRLDEVTWPAGAARQRSDQQHENTRQLQHDGLPSRTPASTLAEQATRRQAAHNNGATRAPLSNTGRKDYSTTTGILPIRACHSRGPVLCTDSPVESTATVTGMSCTVNS